MKGSPDFTETADADARKPAISPKARDAAPTMAEGPVERESIVEYIEK